MNWTNKNDALFRAPQRRLLPLIIGACLTVAVMGCSTPSASSPTGAAPTAAVTANTTVPAATTAPTAVAATTAPVATTTASGANPTASTSAGGNTVTLVVVSEKSEARYRVREQLAGVNLPSDAVGATSAITGQIVGKLDGSIDSANSKFVVDVQTLKSDQFQRDGFIQRTPLQTSQYPYVTFVPTSATGLPASSPVPTSATFQLMGNLTVKDVTKPVTWNATCNLQGGGQTEGLCNATTSFTFADFNLEQPHIGRVISIEDTIKLEVDLYLKRANP